MPSPSEMETAIWRAIDKIQNAYERRMVSIYKTALDEIRSLLSKLYVKYADSDGVLTYAEMTKYNRLKAVHDSIVEIIGPVFSKNSTLVDKLAMVQYEEGFFRHAWSIDNQAGVSLSWGMPDPKAIDAAVNAAEFRALRDIAIKRLRGEGVLGIDRVITQGLIQGQSYPKMARKLKDYVDGNAAQLLRIARTEGHRASVIGSQALYDDAERQGIEFDEVWDATLDDRTRPEHGALDGKPKNEERGGWYLAGMWVTGPGQSGDPAQDIHCRCTTRAEIKGYPPKVRRIRDEGIQPYITYSDWAEKRGLTENRYGAAVGGR